VKIEARTECAVTVFVSSGAGECDQHDVPELAHLSGAARQLAPVHARKSDVDQHQRRYVLASELKGSRAIPSDAYVVPEHLQQHHQAVGRVRVVIDDEHPKTPVILRPLAKWERRGRGAQHCQHSPSDQRVSRYSTRSLFCASFNRTFRTRL
jgi:hypothetical protein